MRRSKGYRTSELLSRAQNCRRRVFTISEDKTIIKYVSSSKFNNNWDAVAKLLPWRSARQCRDRWTYYLSPSNNLEPFSPEEDQLIVQKVNELGKKWANISKFFTGRSDNSIKNRWYSKLKSRCDVDEDGVYSLDPTKVIDAPERVRGHPAKQKKQDVENFEKNGDNEQHEIDSGKNEEPNEAVPEEKSFSSMNSSPTEHIPSEEVESKAIPTFSTVESIFNPSIELQVYQDACSLLNDEPQQFQKQGSQSQNSIDFWDGEVIEWPLDIFNSGSNSEFGFF